MDDKGRARNFSEKETELLVSLVRTYKDIIECKKTDAVTWKQKDDAWETIAKKFNSLSGQMPRNKKNLKGKYDNLKKNTKKKFAEEKIEVFKTGGGSVTPVGITSQDIEIKELLGVGVTGNENIFDGDGINCEHLEVIVQDNPAPVHSSAADDVWRTWAPATLRTPVTKQLQSTQTTLDTKQSTLSRRKNQLTADCRLKINTLAEAKVELIKLQLDALRQEIKQKNLMHETELEIKRVEHELHVEELKKRLILLDKQIHSN